MSKIKRVVVSGLRSLNVQVLCRDRKHGSPTCLGLDNDFAVLGV